MKFNSKTFPNCEDCKYVTYDNENHPQGCDGGWEDWLWRDFCVPIIEWVEGFKKELLEVRDTLAVYPIDDFDKGRLNAILQVLGEIS